MFSVDDATADPEPLTIDLKNYAELGHTHEITDVNNLEERLEAIEEKLNTILQELNEQHI